MGKFKKTDKVGKKGWHFKKPLISYQHCPWDARRGQQKLEEIQKTVDKRKTVCYNLKVVADKRQPSEWKKLKNLLTNARERDTIKNCWVQRRTGKNVKNFRKKFLTNGMKSCIIAMFRRKRRVPCKLNNVTKRKHQTERFPVRNHGGSGQEVAKYEVVNSSERQL